MKLPQENPTDGTPQFHSRTAQPVGGQPWFTYASIAACIGIFVSIQFEQDLQSWDALAKYGYMSPDALRSGAVQGLFAPVFVHFEIWHVGFNMYWLWLLGSALERSIGTPKYIVFYTLAAYVSSVAEFAQSDQTGIGASGVVYAIFGYMWVARSRRTEYREIVDDRTVRLLVGWLFLCVPLTLLDWLPVANAAHFGGILFGMGAAALFALRYRRPLSAGALLLLFTLPAVTLFWCPWSPSWLSDQAYEAHNTGRPKEALRYYTELLEIEPENSWAYNNRGMIYERMGNKKAAEADRERAERYSSR